MLGVHSVAWDEAQNISGKDPDFHKRDLWEAIESGAYPEWELGIQIVAEDDEFDFDFDLLDPTKIIPEELVPVQRIGKMTLNRNPDNFFAETEQVAFHPGHIVPGIDFTNDPLLQGRLFSYTDTQLSRLGSPNFHEIPINRPIAPVVNNQRDGHMRQTIYSGKTSYQPNSLAGDDPSQAKAAEGGFTSYQERIDSKKIRERSKSFFDHFSQATLFFNSQSEPEKNHIIDALTFELGKVDSPAIRERMTGILTRVDKTLAARVAAGLGIPVPKEPVFPINHSVPADGNQKNFEPLPPKKNIQKSDALSMANTLKNSIKSRCIAILAADGFDEKSLAAMKDALEAEGAKTKIVAPKLGTLKGASGKNVTADQSFLNTASVLFDAIYIPSGAQSANTLMGEANAVHFINEAYKHCKAIAAQGDGVKVLQESYIKPGEKNSSIPQDPGILIDKGPKDFIAAIAKHRVWEREKERKVPA